MKRTRLLPLVTFALLGVLLFAGCSEDRSPVQPDLSGSEIARPASPLPALAPPAGYYDAVDAGTQAALRATLHEVIDDNLKIPYTSDNLDTWDVLEAADEDPDDSGHILDIYLNASYQKWGEGNLDYNREHSWAKSYGFPNDNLSNYPYTDCHHLFLANDSYNTSRSNKPFRYCDAACLEKPTEYNDGVGGGSGVYPGNSNWTSGSYTEGTWETWIGRRGDVARALLYMDVRYEGGTHGVTGIDEPDLILTDNEALIAASNTGSNESVAYMGMLSVLLEWHLQDPVDDKERVRNDAVYAAQGNRNPFIDHPEWVACVFLGDCSGGGDTTPPAAPTGLSAGGGDGLVTLDWDDNGEADLSGYFVFRATTSGGPYTLLNGTPLTSSAYDDTDVTNGTTYWYVVTAVDTSDNESALSAEANATPEGGVQPPVAVWINEFHYDNDGADKNEFVEVAGTAGTDLTGWKVYGYNGADGAVYASVSLAGAVPNQQNGFGVVAAAFVGMQNGSPDGLALVDGAGQVVQFLSYEGSFAAVDGPAVGTTSIDIGISEPADAPRRTSLQLAGSGDDYADFYWEGPLGKTDGSVNENQTFVGGGGDVTPPAVPTGLGATAGDGTVALDWDDNGEPDLDGYFVYRATASGGPYDQVNGSPLSGSDYLDTGVSNGTTYWYVVTAVDLTGNEGAAGAEVSATPQGGATTPVHVAAIQLSTFVSGPKEFGRAVVTVVDDQDAPVAGATVTGTFSGGTSGTDSGTTAADGTVTLESAKGGKAGLSFTFCVDDVAGAGLSYDSAANVVTCDTW